jgi:N-acetylmuramoyl-L-alanine amidase
MDFGTEIAKRTIWMEARGEGVQGMRAVAHVICNRLKDGRWGKTLASVCLWPYQFSSWDTTDPNRKEMALLADDDPSLSAIGALLEAAVDGEPDPTKGAMWYYATTMPAPGWAQNATMTAQVGRQVFYTGVV